MRFVITSLGMVLTMASPAAAVNIVTDIAPIQSLVAGVAEGIATPDALISSGASAHDFSLKPSDMRTLQSADLLIWTGPILSTWMPRALAAAGDDVVSVSLSQTIGTNQLTTEDGHIDPHDWLDPANAVLWTSEIAQVLSDADPENADRYAQNAAEQMAEIDALSDKISSQLAGMTPKFITLHDGFGYFEERFGVHAAGQLSEVDHHEISPGRLRTVSDLAKEQGINCLVIEPGTDAHVVETIFGDADVTVVELDPLGASLEPGPGLYTALLRQIADGLASCEA